MVQEKLKQHVGQKLTELRKAEIDAAIQHVADQLSLDLYSPKPPRHVKVFADGAPNAEDTWVGICTLCEARHVTNLDPKKHLSMPVSCGESMGDDRPGATCTGNVLLSPDSDALLAAFKIGGWEALRDESGCGRVVEHIMGIPEVKISTEDRLPGGGTVRTMERRQR